MYSTDGIPGMEAVEVNRCLAFMLSNKPKQEHLEMCDFVRAQMSLTIVRSNTILLRGARDKEA